ncbi:HET-domain-containing protein, partial [Byssothecium circinans]
MSRSVFIPDIDAAGPLSKQWDQKAWSGTAPHLAKSSCENVQELRRVGVPAHLQPFIPYVEKEKDESRGKPVWEKRAINPVKTVKEWLEACDVLHADRCGSNIGSDDNPWSGPLLLIDVENLCLVPAPPGARYVALSYTWGVGGTDACTTKENLARLREQNSLSEESFNMLPRTIRDAMALTHGIGERYLWVDRFCIVQDETLAKQSQLQAMGNIYANSLFTLVAANGDDASSPLYEAGPATRISIHPPDQNTGHGMSSEQILLNQSMYLRRCNWYSRAWTFQEYLFSKRRVVFQSDTMNFECLQAAWHEGQDLSRFARSSQLTGSLKQQSASGFKHTPWPDVARYARLVSLFSQRDLTFPEDVLDAFAGILSELSRTFPKGFISGLPVMSFDAVLLWQPWTYMQRRRALKCSASDAFLPSWSWVGWNGDMDSMSWRSASSYLFEHDEQYGGQQCSWRTVSTVSWEYS